MLLSIDTKIRGDNSRKPSSLQTELKEIKRTGFTNKDMLNTLLGPVNL